MWYIISLKALYYNTNLDLEGFCMLQTSTLLTALKQRLRANGITYADVAKALNLSEASIKRLFSHHGFTLARLEEVCALANTDLIELVQIAQAHQRQVEQLTEAQEKEIAADILLLLVAVSVINGFSYDELLSHFQLSATECIQKLAQLDRLKLIELHPGNRIKLRIAPNFRWKPDGPIQRFFLKYVQQDFFNSRFDNKSEKLLVLNGLFSHASNQEIQDRIDRLAMEFHGRLKKDYHLPMQQKHGTTMVIGLRQWRYSLFEDYMK